jgi:diguanylate cyclase (GGDEF)-like protein/PAS domain S-box-containing protein
MRSAVSATDGHAEPARDLGAAERTLRNSEQHLREILDSAPVAFICTDAEGLIVDWNAQAELVFGWSRVDALGRDLAHTVLPHAVRSAYERDLADLLAASDPQELSRSVELSAVRRDGQEFPVELTVSRLSAGDCYLFHVFARDMSAQAQADQDLRYAEDQLAHQALHDPLTGLPNRTLLLDRVTHAVAVANRHGTVSALLNVDVDNFKLVNDGFGHPVGDELLVRVVRRLQGVLRASDTIARVGQETLARIGADEFVVLCEALSSEQDAVDIAERIGSVLAEPFAVADERFFVKVSIGIAVTGRGVTPWSLIRDADAAMHRAKERGGARYELFDAGTRGRVLDRMRRENELRDAIELEQLSLFYQPIVSVVDGGMVGVEALLRWQHPQHGLVPPANFIPLAEESGLIIPIGRWVLEQAWAQLAEWHATPGISAPLHVSVNVSARQLLDDNVANVVAELMELHPIKPSRLIVELTESSLMDDTDERVAVLDRLKALGVRLALDDFGTGYSSLGYLRRLPFDVLKLDRSFVSNLDQTTTDPQIAAAMIEMARALAMTVVAEGVETQEQHACLRRLGCHYAQGYYFASPMPADVFAEWNSDRGREYPNEREADASRNGTSTTGRGQM